MASDESFTVSTPVIAEWHDSSDACCRLGCGSQSLTLELHINHREQIASLKLRLHLALAHYSKKRNVYLLVDPAHLSSLRLQSDSVPIPDRLHQDLAQRDNDIIGMHMHLHQPSAILAQSNTRTEPKGGPSERAFSSLCSLSRQTDFTLYVARASFTDTQLSAFRGLANADGPSFHLTDGELVSLYAGKGATVIYAPADATEVVESPPSYDELALSSPPPPQPRRRASQPPAAKRRKQHDDSDDATRRVQPAASGVAADTKGAKEHHPPTDTTAWRAGIQQRLDELNAMVSAVRDDMQAAAACVPTGIAAPGPPSAPAPAPAEEPSTPTTVSHSPSPALALAAAATPSSLATTIIALTTHIQTLQTQLNTLESRLEARLSASLDAKLEARLSQISEDMADDVMERVEQRFEQHAEERDEVLDDALHVRDREWEGRLDDVLLEIKEEARERVREELGDVEASIRGDLRNAL